MAKNRIILSIPRLEKEHNYEDENYLTPDIFDVEDSEFLILDDNLHYKFKAQLIASGLVIKGIAYTNIKTRCSRCLAPLIEEIECKYTLFYDNIDSDEIDITDDIREELMLEIPMNSLCDEDCQGLDESIHDDVKEPSVWDALNNLDLK